jgi:hypothetical protein
MVAVSGALHVYVRGVFGMTDPQVLAARIREALTLLHSLDGGTAVTELGDDAEAALAELIQIAERARAVVDAYTAQAEDWNDGEFSLWGKDDLVNAIVALRAALAGHADV